MIEISNKNDVQSFVDEFYALVREDGLIGPVFNERIHSSDWLRHLERMYSFWNTVLFGQTEYRGNPFPHHTHLPIDKKHFDRWIMLLTKVIKDGYEGDKADEVLFRAEKMSQMFQSKLEYIRSNPSHESIM